MGAGRRLDPGVVTSIAQTFLLKGDLERAIALDAGNPPLVKAIALVQSGRASEGVGLLQGALERGLHPTMRDEVAGILAVLTGRFDEIVDVVSRMLGSSFRDPEGFYHWAGALAQAGDHDGALVLLERSVDGGFYAASSLARYPWFKPLRATSDFALIVERAEALQRGPGGVPRR